MDIANIRTIGALTFDLEGSWCLQLFYSSRFLPRESVILTSSKLCSYVLDLLCRDIGIENGNRVEEDRH